MLFFSIVSLLVLVSWVLPTIGLISQTGHFRSPLAQLPPPQAATSAELVGSCGAAATETNSHGAPSAVNSLAACRTSGDLQAARS